MILTRRLKVRPNYTAWLDQAAGEVNQVWNYLNEIRWKAGRGRYAGNPRYLSNIDLCNLTSHATEGFSHIGADTIQRICYEIAAKGKQFHKDKFRWRSSRKTKGLPRTLGWIPFKPTQLAKRNGDRFRFGGKNFRLFEELPTGKKLVSGSFAQDNLGDWYCCISYEEPEALQSDPCGSPAPDLLVGIDPGVKAVATASDGQKLIITAGRQAEQKIAQLQRRRHRRQAKLVNKKVKRQRLDALHKFSTRMVKQYQNIYMGNVSHGCLAGRNRHKAVADGSLSTLKNCLQYKSQVAGRQYREVAERFTTVTCSHCTVRSGPAGLAGLSVRQWQCRFCGTRHDRDLNASINIACVGVRRYPPLAGTSQGCFSSVELAIHAMRGRGRDSVPAGKVA